MPTHALATTPPCPADLLRCPVSGAPVSWMDEQQQLTLYAQIENQAIRHRDGSVVRGPLHGAYVTANGEYAYAVRDDVVLLMRELALVPPDHAKEAHRLRGEKRAVQTFYDEVGWTTDENGEFADTRTFEDRRSVSEDYVHRCHLRVKQHLPERGRYLLDVASGPVQYPEYLDYARGFDRRVCVDLSYAALQAARRRVGESGIYILGDITNLPLRDESMDAAISLHTIYHVPADEQASAFRELARVVRTGQPAVVVYAWRSAPVRWLDLPRRMLRAPLRLARRPSASQRESLFFHAHRRQWFVGQRWPFEFEISCWRSVTTELLRTYAHRALLGRRLLSGVFALETRFPGFAGRVGAYPLIVIRGHASQADRA